METGSGAMASNALRSRRPTPTHTASEPRRQRTPQQRPPAARRQSAYPFQPMPVSFLSDSSDDSEHTSPSPSQTAGSQSHSHSHSHSHTSSQTSSHYADPVSRFGIPYARKSQSQSRPSLGTPRASFSASSDSSAPHPRTPGSQSQDSGRWREAGVVVGGGGGLQQDAWLAHVAEEMAASLSRLAESVRAARAELDETRAVLDARRTRVLLAASGSTESWSASAFDPAFKGPPRAPFVPPSQSAESYYTSSTSGGPVASPSFFTTTSTTSSISYSSMSYSEASTAESPSYSSFYTTSPSASMSQGSFA